MDYIRISEYIYKLGKEYGILEAELEEAKCEISQRVTTIDSLKTENAALRKKLEKVVEA